MLHQEGQKLNKDRVDRLVKYIMSNDPTKAELKELVDKINENLPDNQKITDKELNSAFGRSVSRKKSEEKRKLKRIVEKAKQIASMDVVQAREYFSNFVRKSLPAFSGYRRLDVIKILDAIEDVKSAVELNKHISNFEEIVNDFKYKRAYKAAETAKKKISSRKKSRLPVNEKALWRKFRHMQLSMLSREQLEEYSRLINGISRGKKSVKSTTEFDNWYVLLDEMKSFADKYDEIYNANIKEESNEQSTKTDKKPGDGNKRKASILVAMAIKVAKRNLSRFKEQMSDLAYNETQEFIELAGTAGFLTEKQTEKLAEAIRYLAHTGELTDNAGNLFRLMRAHKRAAITSRITKNDVEQMKGISKLTKNLRTTAQIAEFMGKFNRNVSNRIYNTFFSRIMELDSKIHDQHRNIMKEINSIAERLKMKQENLVRVQLYSNIFTTKNRPDKNKDAYLEEIKSNVKKYRQAILNKIQAAEEGGKGINKSDAKAELKIFDQLIKDINSKGRNNVLTDAENELRGHIMDVLESMKDDFRRATLAHAGKSFDALYEYMPTRAIGAIDGEIGSYQGEEVLTNILEGGPKKISEMESGFSRTKGENINRAYYENNVINVVNKFVAQSLYDTNVLSEVLVLNKLLTNKDIKARIGGDNVEYIKQSLIKSVKRGRGNFDVQSDIIKLLEKWKNYFVVGRMGTVFQLSTQLLTSIPAIAISNPKGFAKAGQLMMTHFVGNKSLNIPGHPDVKNLRDWIGKFGHGLQNRDVMFERFEALADYSRFKEGWAKTEKKAENATTWMLRKSDAMAAYWNFFSSYFEQGGTLEKPNRDKISNAQRDTDLLQNVSNPRFTSNQFRPDSDNARAIASFLYTFKSFAINQSLNTLYGIKHFNEPAARKLAIANLSNIVLYHISTIMLSKWLGEAIAAAIGDDEEKEKAKSRSDDLTRNFWQKIAARSISDVFVSWMPQFVESMIQEGVDSAILKAREAYTGEDINNRDNKLFYGSWGSPVEHLGGYSGPLEYGWDFQRDLLKLSSDEMEATEFILKEAAASVNFIKALPFRGDIARVIRTYNSIQKQGTNKKGEKKYKDTIQWN
jgi:hypothetical protein